MKRHGFHSALLLAPWVLTFGVFWLVPLVQAFYLSFTEYQTLTNQTTWVGMGNYVRLFEDETFWTALANTSLFTFGTIPLTLTFATVLAATLHSLPRFQGFFRAAYFLPSVTSLVVISLIFLQLYTADGYVNGLLKFVGVPFPKRGWLQEPDTALWAIMAMDVWISTGYYMVLLLAALQTISRDLYEVAELAGASKRQQFWRITLPMLRPSLLFVAVLNTIKSFQVFVEMYVMTKGGPLDATTTVTYLVYINAFERSDMMGYACAVAYVMFAIMLSFSLIQMYFLQIDKAIGED